MREIKFRGWDRNEKKMVKITGIRFSDVQHTLVRHRYVNTQGKVIDDQSHIDEEGVGSIILMQYTGLKDKNGCDGYHKDIWLYHGVTYTVEWDDENAMFYLKHPSENATEDEHIPMSEFPNGEIIGNAFENPELLEGRHAETTDTAPGS